MTALERREKAPSFRTLAPGAGVGRLWNLAVMNRKPMSFGTEQA